MQRLIAHYIAQFRLARINNTFFGALREILRPSPF